MISIVADVTTCTLADGGLPWGLWHDIHLWLIPASTSTRLKAEVKAIEQVESWDTGTTHIVCFDLLEPLLEPESMSTGSNFEVWFGRWLHVDQTWQDSRPVAHGVITYIPG